MTFKMIVMGTSCLAVACVAMPVAALAEDAATAQAPGADAPATNDAAAQGADGMAEIVVTAQRRNQHLQDVPITVAAISGSTLRTQEIRSIVDVGRLIPGVTVASNTGGQAAAFSIRGVTLSDFNDGAEAPVAVYVDETYLPNVQAQSSAMFDIDHIEALKGPQGTLFGRNSTGGLVNILVTKPSEDTKGYIDGTYGSFNQGKIEGAVGGSVTDNVQARASILYDHKDGWLHNDYPGQPDLGGYQTAAGRLQLQSEIADGLTARLSGSYFHEDMSSAPYSSISTTAVKDTLGRVVAGFYNTTGPDLLGYTAPAFGTRVTNSNYACASCTGMDAGDVALHLTYDAGSFQIFSITDYYSITKHLKLDGDVTPVNFLDVSTNGETASFSQELRATGKSDDLVWNAGAYYLNILVDTQSGYIMPAGSLYAAKFYPTYAVSGLDAANVTQLHKQAASAFGQIEYEFLPKLTFTLGGRLIHEWQSYNFQSDGFANLDNFNLDTSSANYLFTAQPSFVGSNASNYWTGKVGLSYKPTDDWLLYVSVNRGIRGAGFNNKLPGGTPLTAAQVPYDAETLVSYEGGFKSQLWDGKLILDGAAYHYDYHNYQAFLFLTAGGFIENADASTDGAELAVTVRPITGLELQVSGSYNNSNVQNLPIAPGVNRNVTPTYAPRRQIAASASYTPPMEVANGSVTLSANLISISSFYTNIRNFSSEHLPGYTVAAAQLIWENDAGYSITAAISNLFDEHYAINETDLSTLCGCTEITYGQPREYRLTMGYRF